MTTKDSILHDALVTSNEREVADRLSVEKLLDKYQQSSKKYDVIIKRINISQEHKTLVRDYQKTYKTLIALEEIKQIVSQGRSTKVGAPDDTEYGKQLSIMEKIAATLMGWLGLSSTGMAQETNSVISTEQRYNNFIDELTFNTGKIKTALESVEDDIEPDILSAIKQKDSGSNYFNDSGIS